MPTCKFFIYIEKQRETNTESKDEWGYTNQNSLVSGNGARGSVSGSNKDDISGGGRSADGGSECEEGGFRLQFFDLLLHLLLRLVGLLVALFAGSGVVVWVVLIIAGNAPRHEMEVVVVGVGIAATQQHRRRLHHRDTPRRHFASGCLFLVFCDTV